MKYRNILVPYDRSDSAKRALATALEFAQDVPGAKVTVFFAAPIPEFESSEFMIAERVSGTMRTSEKDLLRMQEDYLKFERGLLEADLGATLDGETVALAVGKGRPGKAILDYAAACEADLIVMGSRGLNAVAGVLGSVSYAVLRNATCPVLVEK